MRVDEFDYYLPKSLIAQYPTPYRGESRLMVLNRAGGTIEHRAFEDLKEYLNANDLLVFNNTRVLPARLIGHKETGGKVELLLIPIWKGENRTWEALVKNVRHDRQKIRIFLDQTTYLEVTGIKDGKGMVTFPEGKAVEELIRKVGHIPLPPYIRREDEPLDRDRYQTVYAEKDGSIAAPTAGLHFTEPLIRSLKKKGVKIAYITLHVGPGTFLPVKTERIEEHRMDREWAEITKGVAEEINEVKRQGGKVVAVGTTTTRALESFSEEDGRIKPGRDLVSLFIRPPYAFKTIDALITNFHLPKSTLIMLVSAFAGREFILKAYREAVESKYRFYSYGDAMLIL